MKTFKNHRLIKPFNLLIPVLLLVLIMSCTNESIEEVDLTKTESETLSAKKKNAATWQEQIEILDQKMQRFHNFQVSQAQGYTVQANPYVPQMGYHMLNPDLVNGEFNLLEPEILVYHVDENGNMVFGAVEYLVPVMDLDNPPAPPTGFIGDEDHWHLNPAAGGWALHAWVGIDNPDGVFMDFNPNVPATPPN
jgi:hypothetical protein